jgi:hypothetical protein
MPLNIKVLEDGRIELSGSTFHIRDQIRARGGRWQPAERVWILPAGTSTDFAPPPPPPPPAVVAPVRRSRGGGRCCAAAEVFFASSDPYSHYGPASYRCSVHGVSHSTYSGT